MISKLDQAWYPEATRYWDDERFASIVEARLSPGCKLLDVGAGRGKNEIFDFRNYAEVHGVDVDPAVHSNPQLHQSMLMEDLHKHRDCYDVACSANVMEHVENPLEFLDAIKRALKPGGVYLAKTPNAWHYMPMVARCTPIGFHRWFNSLRGRDVDDTFCTYYRCNTIRAIRNIAKALDMKVDIQLWSGRPEYLRVTTPTYLAGIAYERLVNATELASPFRAVIVSEFTK